VRLGVFAWPNPEEPRLNREAALRLRQGTVMAMLIAWKEFGRVRDGNRCKPSGLIHDDR